MIKIHGLGHVTEPQDVTRHAPHGERPAEPSAGPPTGPRGGRDAVRDGTVVRDGTGAPDETGARDEVVVPDRVVVPERVAEWTFAADPGAVRAARAAVCRQLDDWGVDDASDIAALVVSELVTNAVRYAGAPIGVRLTRRPGPPGTLLVEVSDPVPDPPHEHNAELDDEGGRGLHMLALCSRSWGTRCDHAGKTVWFELSAPRPAER